MTPRSAIATAGTILGSQLSGATAKPISHHGSGTIFTITTPDSTYLLKTYLKEGVEQRGDPQRFANIESHNLAIVNSLSEFARPYFYGRVEQSLLQDYVEGKLLQEVCNQATPSEQHSYYAKAVETLAAVHSSVAQVPDRRRLRRSFSAQRLEKTIAEAIARITDVGLSAYESKRGPIPLEWRQSLQRFPQSEVVSSLAVTTSYILGHGDFKPDNLIVGTNGRIWVIDWLSLSKAQPWYDLSYLLVLLPEKRKADYVDQYTQAMQQRGYLKGLSSARATTLFRSGRMYQELIRARSNALFLRDRPDTTHHADEFSSALSSLSEIMAE